MDEKSFSYQDYIAWKRLPHLWCPGCGHGIVLKAITLALAELGIPPERALLASGIGCSGRTGDYVSFHRFQGTHGRALGFATGIHAVRPEMALIAFLGDGDCYAIGGNHLLHAARRNINVTTIVGNNCNYGMTGGQFSPSTPEGSITTTSILGKSEFSVDMCSLVAEAGANFVARTTVYHAAELNNFIREAIATPGFSFVEVVTPCPTYFGRYNDLGDAVGMLRWLKDTALPKKRYDELAEEEKPHYFLRGIIAKRQRQDFVSKYREISQKNFYSRGGGKE